MKPVARALLLLALLLPIAQGAWAQSVLAPSAQQSEAADPQAPADPMAALLSVLQDDAAREKLIAELQQAGADTAEAAAAPDEEVPVLSLARQLAVVTQGVAEGVAAQAQGLWATLRSIPDAFTGLGNWDVGLVAELLGDLVVVIAVTVAVFVLLRRSALPLYRRLGARARSASWGRRILIFLGAETVDLVTVLAAWALGYAAMLVGFGDYGEIGLRQVLYLNAFLVVEGIKVVLRLVLSPATGDMRPLPLADRPAQLIYRLLAMVVTLTGYGQLLLVPVLNANTSLAAGRSLSALISMIVLLVVSLSVLRHRRAVAGWLLEQGRTPVPPGAEPVVADPLAEGPEGEAEDASAEEEPVMRPLSQTPGTASFEGPPAPEDEAPSYRPSRSGAFATLALNWHWLALAWLAFIGVTILTRPPGAVAQAIGASGRVVLVVVVGLIVSGLLGRAIARGLYLPDHVKARLPLLERRLNGFVPRVLMVLRVLIAVVVVAVVLDTLSIVDTSGWLQSRVGLRLSAGVLSVGAIILASFVLWLGLSSWVDYRLNPDFGSVPTAREQTLLTLLRNAATIAIVVLTLMFALSQIGLDIAPLLASAGVLGLAIGFGAQKLVQDIITGIFIQFENAINVGDVVTAGGITGVVEKLTVRSVSLRDLQGLYHLIPFSSVDLVSNYTRDFSYYVLDMGVAYREDVGEAKQALFDAFDELQKDPENGPFLTSELEWFGLDAFGDSAVVLKCRIKTLPGKQWGVGRAYNEIVKRIFDERGIEIPFPHQTLYFGETKAGRTQTLHLAQDGATGGAEADRDSSAGDEAPGAQPG
ncbi:mechanosensitive ion channel domain-containing protein [Pseudoroseicyclus aestuarii]|uniref:Small-conductance mechanosensitive channel n=1 Tax=Pseudoroseicyclus aestuarii TaxID=1795041 RepID=A0A318SYW0_9RHOB|nr:mechanosensitive ion channel domain-containing protein [Pseudoroseicyclus aestuarii]PYE84957.1 small-conductance mechanosensitive channel [Pseudoroseicyclus aestuarii]